MPEVCSRSRNQPARLSPARNRPGRRTFLKAALLVLLMGSMVLGIFAPAGAPAIRAAGGWSDIGIPRPPTDQASFLAYLVRIGQPVCSRIHGYPASYDTFHNYKLLVYGTPAQVPNNRYSATWQQYAYLGFSYDERSVTNSLFPDDAPGGVTQTNPISWAELSLGSAATASWQRLDEPRRNLLKSVQLFYRGQPFGLMTCGSLGIDESKAIVLAPPSWHLGSALYTEHYLQRSGYQERRYATFTCNGGGGAELDCVLEVLTPPDSDQAYAFEPGQDQLHIAYRVTGGIRTLTGLASDADIVLRGVGTDDGFRHGSGRGPFVYEGVRVLDRSILAGAESGVAEIRATAFVVSAMGDMVLQEQVHYLPLRAPKAPEPLTVEASITGSIGYFSGARTLAGRTLAESGRRFLGLETAWLNVRFSRPPGAWSYTFNGETTGVPAADGQCAFQVPVRMPLGQDTLDWSDGRLRPALGITISATDPKTAQIVGTLLAGIELTGDIYDLLYLQTAN